ncbi:SDR family NAD(P)-dependent oxidoreductase [Cryobacterium sp. Y62]|uniref:SDR family NAD(P)-dependent oxidoreductase n=1 Tax=Cryobacterium sp. Y62 TaxID=2048284 RepID=UPI000CE468C6|nr:SDR family oxidoreductase [Cryobacterium sp. Y62]
MRDLTRFGGKVAIVTGAGSADAGDSIGYAIARLLVQRGAKVALVDLSIDRAIHSLGRLTTLGASAEDLLAVSADVSSIADARAAVASCVERFGRVDVLVNNVGVTEPTGTAVDLDEAAWDRGMAINVRAAVAMSGASIPHMVAQGSGSIVHMGSIQGLRGGHPALMYPVSKGALLAMTQSMAVHHGRQGIRVNYVAPGYVYTPRVASRGMSEDERRERAESTLLGTEGTAWDVAEAVAFLASDQSRWITGVALPVDAGTLAGDPLAVVPLPGGDR